MGAWLLVVDRLVGLGVEAYSRADAWQGGNAGQGGGDYSRARSVTSSRASRGPSPRWACYHQPLTSSPCSVPHPSHHAHQAKAARQAGPLPEIQAGAGEAVAEGVTRQKVLQPNRKAMEVASAVDISQVGGRAGWWECWVGGLGGMARGLHAVARAVHCCCAYTLSHAAGNPLVFAPVAHRGQRLDPSIHPTCRASGGMMC